MSDRLGALEITVATGSFEADKPLDLAHETRLVKAALLYADHVTLASPKVVMLGSMATILSADASQRRQTVLAMMDSLPDGASVRPTLGQLQKKKRKSVDELLLLRRLEERLHRAGEELAAKVHEILQLAGASELEAALEAEVVSLDPLGMDESGWDTAAIVRRLAELLREIVAPASSTFPMFDDTTGGLLRAMVREGLAPGADLGHATQAALGSRFVTELDAFPDAPMTAVLDVREALRAPLVKFRAAVIDMERGLEVTPLDENFERVSRDLYLEHVAPALEELEEIAKQLRVRLLLGHELLSGGGRRVAEAAVSFAAVTVAELPGLTAAALGVGADIAASAYSRREDLQEKRAENRFLFLYEAEHRLRA